jgi:hypothetical protein
MVPLNQSQNWTLDVRGKRIGSRSKKVGRAQNFAFVAAIAVLVPGCAKRTDRLQVSGQVILDGTPLESGSIRFTATNREKFMAAGAMIKDGAYKIPRDKGLVPGTYQVEISAPDDKSPLTMTPVGNGRSTLVARERIPPEYNTNSTQKIEVTADGDNKFEFNIASKPTK